MNHPVYLNDTITLDIVMILILNKDKFLFLFSEQIEKCQMCKNRWLIGKDFDYSFCYLFGIKLLSIKYK